MQERGDFYRERPPSRKYARISPEHWNWAFTDWSLKALKASVVLSAASGLGIAASIASNNQLGFTMSLYTATFALPTTICLAAKEKIEADVRRENNITRSNV